MAARDPRMGACSARPLDLFARPLLRRRLRGWREATGPAEAGARRARAGKAKAVPGSASALPVGFVAPLAVPARTERQFRGIGPGARHEYLGWFELAWTVRTRARRMAEASGARLAEGKRRPWKHET